VAAIFVNDDPEARSVQVQPIEAGQWGTAKAHLALTAKDAQPISISIRVGPGKPGEIYLNGDSVRSSPGKPLLTIDEYQPFWP